uniref:Calcium voltage-gated channel auxiliary subunit beta 1 n=1 Tax=Rousettus aegyptiacus TaxID=9407 RepID=A0A7J8G5V4_ROUAE|nr:calcium voltage-gated channel auxiliary subunit beta 1 [Rousettus aegyptiacus]
MVQKTSMSRGPYPPSQEIPMEVFDPSPQGKYSKRKGRFKRSDGSTSSDTTSNSFVRQGSAESYTSRPSDSDVSLEEDREALRKDACEHLAEYLEAYWKATHPPSSTPPNPLLNRTMATAALAASPAPVSNLQGPYLASGDQSLERATGEHASVHEYPGELGQPPGHYPSSHPPGRVGTMRALSRQDTFDADTSVNRNSAYTELGDSCVDMETDPSEGPGLGDPAGGSTPPARQGSWEDEEDYEEELTDNRNRGRNKARYCAEGGGPVLGRNKNELEGWGRGVYIR